MGKQSGSQNNLMGKLHNLRNTLLFPLFLSPFPLTPVTPLPSGPRTAMKHVLSRDQQCSMDVGPGVPAGEDGQQPVGGLGKPGCRCLPGVRVLPVGSPPRRGGVMAGTWGARQVTEYRSPPAGTCSSVSLPFPWHAVGTGSLNAPGANFQFRKPWESSGTAAPPEPTRWALWPGSLACAGSLGTQCCDRSLP